MKGALGNLMKQAQQMQAELQRAQDEIADLEIDGQAGGGLVAVTMTGRHDVKRVAIDTSVLGDKEMLEDLVAAAVNDANRKVEDVTKERMSGLAGGLELPPGFKLPL